MYRVLVSLLCLVLWGLAAPLLAPAALRDISRFSRITIGDEIPMDGCTPSEALHILEPYKQLFVCSEDSLTYMPTAPGMGAGVGVSVMPCEVTELGPGSFNLGMHCKVWVTVGTSGASFTLPDASDLTKSRDIRLIIKDAGEGCVTLSPSPTQTINGLSSAPSPVLCGKGSEYHAERMDSTEWRVTELSTVGTGVDFLIQKRGRVMLRPGGRMCSVGPSNTNDSGSGSGAVFDHNLSCIIEATGGAADTGSLMEGDVIHVYVGWKMVNGATQSTGSMIGLRNGAGGTKFIETGAWSTFTNLPFTGGVAHYIMRVGADPGASTPIVTLNVAGGGLWREAWIGTDMPQPVNFNTLTDLELTPFSKFGTAGSSDNEMTVLFMIVEIR